MTVTIGICAAQTASERRVPLVPEVVAKFTKRGLRVVLPKGAGLAAGFDDAAYASVGADVLDAKQVAATSVDIALALRLPERVPYAGAGVMVGLGICSVAGADVVLALEKLPRTSRAQAMDVLSSQANLGGYAAALAVAQHLPRLMPPLTTAAGSSKPAKVLVLGVGVAGLQAIATARRLGAAVTAFDVRPEVAEQIRSLGAKVVEVDGPTATGQGGYAGAMDAQGLLVLQEKLLPFIAASDGVIATAQVPGKPAPVLVSVAAVDAMRRGSVVVDLATGGYNLAHGVPGGNCPLSVADQVVAYSNGVVLVGETNWPSRLAETASRFWATNMANLLGILIGADNVIRFDDELVAAMKVAA
jgi:NAD(P) transhydrogenase subunit alpha